MCRLLFSKQMHYHSANLPLIVLSTLSGTIWQPHHYKWCALPIELRVHCFFLKPTISDGLGEECVGGNSILQTQTSTFSQRPASMCAVGVWNIMYSRHAEPFTVLKGLKGQCHHPTESPQSEVVCKQEGKYRAKLASDNLASLPVYKYIIAQKFSLSRGVLNKTPIWTNYMLDKSLRDKSISVSISFLPPFSTKSPSITAFGL